MAKEFKDWIDEFVENGANPKNVPHWPEEAGGGGTKVVTELPQVGEEHTIYELQEVSKASYGWMFTLPMIDTSESINLVFDTYEQMTKTINEVKVIEGNTYHKRCLAYIRNTNQMYMLNPVFTDQPHWEFRELPKQDDESGTDYAFKVEYTEDKGSAVVSFHCTYYILKEFVANERPVADGGFEYSGITLDDKEVYVGSSKFFGVLSNITYPRWTMLFTSFFGYPGAFTYDKLPNSVELETKCYNLLRLFGYVGLNNTQFAVYNTTNNAYYMLNPKTTSYQWYNNLEDRENCYFAQSGDYEGEPPHYTGELEWVYMGSFDDYLLNSQLAFNEIPYNDMINHNPPFDSSSNRGCAFQPKKGGEITSTYWIYTNNEWVNVDEDMEFKVQEKTISPSTNIQEITPDEGYDGLSKVTVNNIKLQYKRVMLDRTGYEVRPDEGYDGLSEVTVDSIKLQRKTVSPTTSIQRVEPDTNYIGLRDVTVNAMKLQEKTVNPTISQQNIGPDTNYDGLSQVTINAITSDVDSNIKAEHIKKDVTILGVTGTYDGGGATYTCGSISTQFPRTVVRMGIATVGSNVYLFGGKMNDYNNDNYIHKFDADTETITTLSTTLPKGMYSMGVAHVGGNIYLFGGYSQSGDEETIYKFNVETEKISTLSTTLPQKLYNMNIATVGSNVYLFGCYSNASSGGAVNTIYKFNAKTETITTLSTTLPQALSSVGAATVGSNVYIFGGFSSNDRNEVDTIYKFDADTETISTLSTKLPQKLDNVCVSQVGSNVYLFGGSIKYGELNTIYKFDVDTETITKLPTKLQSNESLLRAAKIGSKVYLFGGSNGSKQKIIYKFKVNF